MKTYIHLTGEQSALYDQSVQALMDKMKELEGIKRKGAILSALTQLKQLCDHPLLLTKEALPETLSSDGSNTEYDLYSPQDMAMLISRSAKLERLMELVRELREEGERCLILPSISVWVRCCSRFSSRNCRSLYYICMVAHPRRHGIA